MTQGRKYYSKRFGQVMLRNPGIASFEVRLLDLTPGMSVLEIGGGQGILTGRILESGVNLVCVEPDGKFAESLRIRFREYVASGKLKVLKEDFLQMDSGEYDRIIGNIPYHISSQILFRLSDFTFTRCVLMVQREFAERMVAEPGSGVYGRLSVNCAFRFTVHIKRKVGKNNFTPVPEVDSAIVELTPRDIREDIDPEILDNVLVKLFSNRRKKVGTVIKECPDEFKDKRPEELSLDDFISVARFLFHHP